MPRRFLVMAAVLVSLVLVVPRATHALPPSPELDSWNEGPEPVQMVGETDAAFKVRRDAWIQKLRNRIAWNCYNYGVNAQTTDVNGKGVRAHPGKGKAWPNLGVNITAAAMCTKTKNRSTDDSLKIIAWNPGDTIPSPGSGRNLVAFGSLAGKKGNGADYHWWRLNGDGTWSHKRGGRKAKTTYTHPVTGAESTLTDPRDANQRDGYTLCGFMSVPKNGGNFGPLAAVPQCVPKDNTVLVQAVGPSGLPDPQRVLTGPETSQLFSHLPTFSPSNQVSDPLWPSPPAGTYQGFFSQAGSVDGLGSIPPYMRVWAGTVEVVLPWPNHAGMLYFHDDHGLESYLIQTVGLQQDESCATADGTLLLSPCQCSDEALGGQPTATLLALFQADAIAEGIELRWQFGDPAAFTAAEIQRAAATDGPWVGVDATTRDENGVSVVLDRDVEGGRTYFYRLQAALAEGGAMTFGPISATSGEVIDRDALAPLHPNPSDGATNVEFALSRPTTVRLSVFDVMGREIAVLAKGDLPAGRYQAQWSGRTDRGAAAAGMYFVRLQLPGRVLSRQVVIKR